MSPSSLPSTAPTPDTAASHLNPALWLVRHGESTWNVQGLAQGHNDEAELTERGLRQAADAAAQFGYRPVRAIYASDLRRLRRRARPARPHGRTAARAVTRRTRGHRAQDHQPVSYRSGRRAGHR